MAIWPFKSKYDRLTREDVVDAICKLQKESESIENGFEATQNQINDLMEKGKKETDRDLKLLYAKKINSLKAEREQNTQRDMYIMYNIDLLNKLKQAIDDKTFYSNTGKASLNNLLSDQKGLAKFLNSALNTRVKAEDVLTSADETFNTVAASYDKNETIYGKNQNDDELLAMFETAEMVENELEMNSVAAPSAENKEDV